MSVAVTLDTVVEAIPGQVSAEVGDEVVILRIETGEYFGVNHVGAAVWDRLQSPATVSEIRDHLLGAYPDVEPERCVRELLALIGEFEAARLIKVHPSRTRG
jgi:hypothetical protein